MQANTLLWLPAFALVSCKGQYEEQKRNVPNIIFVMADDLGYGDLGCYGQQLIRTPNIDRMATEGIRFTNVYAGSPVSAPSRSTLMTGQHTGHTTVRGNKAQEPSPYIDSERVPLSDSDVTIAEMLKDAGYVTGMFGKWGLGEDNTPGVPNNQGFDEWFGYLNQAHAHTHFPDYLWHNQDTFFIEENKNHQNKVFSHDLFTQQVLNFIDENKDTAFYLYVPYTLPHSDFLIPEAEYAQFTEKGWSRKEKVYAGMVERLDKDMGLILEKLKTLGLDSNTIVFFCSDNGAAFRNEGLFNSSGALTGRKRDMYEGGIRVPMIVRMPGFFPAGVESDYPWYFPDVMPTVAELAGGIVPENIDGISVAPLFKGETMPVGNRFMYWEFHEGQYAQAVRWKNWKAVRFNSSDTLELYNLSVDEAEEKNVAMENPEVVNEIMTYLKSARSDSKYWRP